MSPPVDTDVVLVDDDHGVHLFVTRMLRKGAYRLRCFDDGQQALDWLADHRTALLLLDHRMPCMSGTELLALLRIDAAERIVMCTAGRCSDVVMDAEAPQRVELMEKRQLLDRQRFMALLALPDGGSPPPQCASNASRTAGSSLASRGV